MINKFTDNFFIKNELMWAIYSIVHYISIQYLKYVWFFKLFIKKWFTKMFQIKSPLQLSRFFLYNWGCWWWWWSCIHQIIMSCEIRFSCLQNINVEWRLLVSKRAPCLFLVHLNYIIIFHIKLLWSFVIIYSSTFK